jgi:hypothetical protein
MKRKFYHADADVAFFRILCYPKIVRYRYMSDTELLIKEVDALPSACFQEVLDFVGFLRQKYAYASPALSNPDTESDGIDGECPLDHTPNAVTIAAMEEGDAMMRGEIPANSYHTLEEMLEALRK